MGLNTAACSTSAPIISCYTATNFACTSGTCQCSQSVMSLNVGTSTCDCNTGYTYNAAGTACGKI